MSIPQRMDGYRPLVALSAPLAGIQLAQVALTTTDLIIMGSLGFRAIAAGGLAITLHNQLRTMCVGVVTAAGNLVAGTTGRGEARAGDQQLDEQARNEVRQVVRASFLVATLVGLLGAVGLIGLSYALTWFGQDIWVAALAHPTMIALAPGLVPMLWLNILRQFAVGMRRPGSLLGVTIVSIGFNVVLDGGFAYGWLGFPVLGLTGIGLATTIVQVLNFLVFLKILRRDQQLAPLLSVQGWKADKAIAREVFRLGVPISLTYGSEAGITSVATLLMGSFGPLTLAAQNAVNQLTYIVYQANIGLSHGSSILVSRAIGQGNRKEAARIARRALILGATAMALVGLLYLIIPTLLILPFLDLNADPAVESMARTLLLFGIAQQFLKGAQNISIGLLRGLSNTKSGFRITLIGYWVIGIPVMLIFAYGLGLQGPGVWIGLCVGFGSTAVLLLRRFRKDLHQPRSVSHGSCSS
ncbi:MATE family efflux transporter [Streptomyces sp. NPDC127051]|uniref:MATE family efflux transporter n=1 Tax=Streptomyces sp. NPDC127051 TaxID=3347119 RepID=UPI00365B2174